MNKKKDPARNGMALGVFLGVVVWIIFDNLALGIISGIIVGAVLSNRGKSKNDPTEPPVE